MDERAAGSLTILVPGAGGSTGIDAIKRLRLTRPQARIVATDRGALAAGFALADAHFVTRHLSEPQAFADTLERLEREGVRLILPTCRSDSSAYAAQAGLLRSRGLLFVGSDAEIVELCDDKAALKARIGAAFPVAAEVSVGAEGPAAYPCFVKPRRGSGGQGAALCRSPADWRAHIARFPEERIVEAYIPGREYSVDLFSDFKAAPLAAVVRVRIAAWEGVSTKIAVIQDPEIEAMALRLAAFLGLKGASCLQFRRDWDGRLFVQEVNARLGGSSIASALAGVDMVELSVALGLGEPLEIALVRPITVLRYLTELMAPAQVAGPAGTPS